MIFCQNVFSQIIIELTLNVRNDFPIKIKKGGASGPQGPFTVTYKIYCDLPLFLKCFPVHLEVTKEPQDCSERCFNVIRQLYGLS